MPWPILLPWALAGMDALGFAWAVAVIPFGLYRFASEGEGALGGMVLTGGGVRASAPGGLDLHPALAAEDVPAGT